MLLRPYTYSPTHFHATRDLRSPCLASASHHRQVQVRLPSPATQTRGTGGVALLPAARGDAGLRSGPAAAARAPGRAPRPAAGAGGCPREEGGPRGARGRRREQRSSKARPGEGCSDQAFLALLQQGTRGAWRPGTSSSAHRPSASSALRACDPRTRPQVSTARGPSRSATRGPRQAEGSPG